MTTGSMTNTGPTGPAAPGSRGRSNDHELAAAQPDAAAASPISIKAGTHRGFTIVDAHSLAAIGSTPVDSVPADGHDPVARHPAHTQELKWTP